MNLQWSSVRGAIETLGHSRGRRASIRIELKSSTLFNFLLARRLRDGNDYELAFSQSNAMSWLRLALKIIANSLQILSYFLYNCFIFSRLS